MYIDDGMGNVRLYVQRPTVISLPLDKRKSAGLDEVFLFSFLYFAHSLRMLSLSAKELVKQIKSGAINKQDVIRECRERSKQISPLNAFISIRNDDVTGEVAAQGALSGAPIAVKDNFCTKNFKTTCASRMLEDFTPNYNATVVQKLEDSGAVIFGKTNLDEFAMGSGTTDSIYGPTKNIWGSSIEYTVNGEARKSPVRWRIAGGSSGGSAVAVASGVCFGAIGSDTGGSTRNPASYCGVVGLKPTYSTVSRHGLIPLVNSMDVPGILARSVEDVALIYNSICGIDPKDSTTVESSPVELKESRVNTLKIGIPEEFHCEGISTEVLDTWDRVAKLFQANGATIVPISMPHSIHSLACYSIINQCEVASNMAKYDGLRYGHRAPTDESTEALYKHTRSQGFNSVVRARILAGNYFLLQRNYEQFFEKALKVRRLICQDFERAWNQVDILLSPTTLVEAPDFVDFITLDNREQCARSDYCTQPANMSGCPAVSVPIKLSKNEMPLSVQLMAPNYREDSLLSAANWLEKSVKFPKMEVLDVEMS